VLDNPPDPTATYVALVDRGMLAMRRQDWDAALVDLKKAVKLRPDAAPAYINLALTLRQRTATSQEKAKARAEAIGLLDEAIRRHPQEARLYHERAQLLQQLGESQRAREDFARAVFLASAGPGGSTLAEDLIELGRLLHRLKEYPEAVSAYEAVFRLPAQLAS